MRLLKFILPILACLIVLPIVFAGNTETNYFFEKNTNAPVTGVQMLLYRCADSNGYCYNVNGLVFNGNSGANNYLTVEYPGTSAPTDYAEYFYKKGYLPLAFVVEDDYGTGLHFNYNNYFEKCANCHAPVDSFTMQNSVYANEPLAVNVKTALDAKTYSAFTDAGIPPFYVPDAYKDEYYSAKTRVTLNIYNPSGVLVHTESKEVNLYMDTSADVGFEWTPSAAGEGYKAEIVTEVIDDQCSSSVPTTTAKTFNVLPGRPTNECYVLLNDLKTNKQFPVVGDNVVVSYTKISNYADANHVKTAVPMDATYTIKQGKHNPTGTVAYEWHGEIAATSTDTAALQSFTWIPNAAGWYTIYINGKCAGLLCEGKTNDEETISEEIYVKNVPVYSVTFTVTDMDTAMPINGALIDVSGTQKYTGSTGLAVFADVKSGNYVYTISKNGYETKTDSFVVGNVDLYIDVPLKKVTGIENHNPEIKSSPTRNANVGVLYRYDVDATDIDGDTLTYALTTKPSGMRINPSNGLISWTPSNAGSYSVTVEVSDGKGGIATQSYVITVAAPPEEIFNVGDLRVTKLMAANEYLKPGDNVVFSFNLGNIGDTKIENIRITASIEEVGIRARIGPFELKKNGEISKTLVLILPEDMPAGIYYVKITISNDDVQRVKYREIIVI